jgi:electron transport complex protein RnfE
MFGDAAKTLTLVFNDEYNGFLLAVLPPGAFFGLALLIVAKNIIGTRATQKTAPVEGLPEPA